VDPILGQRILGSRDHVVIPLHSSPRTARPRVRGTQENVQLEDDISGGAPIWAARRDSNPSLLIRRSMEGVRSVRQNP